MTTFDTDESSIDSSRPIDLYTITLPIDEYHLTSAHRDVTYNGLVYTAIVMSRGQIEIAPASDGREFLVYMEVSHPVAQRYLQLGVPPGEVHVRMRRLQQVSGEAEQQREGYANSIRVDGRLACLRVPTQTEDRQRVRLPVIVAQPTCGHQLYDGGCQVERVDPTTGISDALVVSNSGTTIVIDDIAGNPDGWATFGEIVHIATEERRMILSQVGTTLTINMPMPDAAVGQGVEVYAGCNHDIETCRDKFANVANFGGTPWLQSITRTINPWKPFGFGLNQP